MDKKLSKTMQRKLDQAAVMPDGILYFCTRTSEINTARALALRGLIVRVIGGGKESAAYKLTAAGVAAANTLPEPRSNP